MRVEEQMSKSDLQFYTEVEQKNQLSLEEKDELIFALLEFLNLRVMRAQYDKSITVLTLKE